MDLLANHEAEYISNLGPTFLHHFMRAYVEVTPLFIMAYEPVYMERTFLAEPDGSELFKGEEFERVYMFGVKKE